MIKKISFLTIVFLVALTKQGFCLYAVDAAYHALPFSPAIDIRAEIVNIAKMSTQTAKQLETLKTEAQTAKNNMQLAITSSFKIFNQALIDSRKEMEETFFGKKATEVSSEEIKDEVSKNLMQYKSRNFAETKFVDEMREKFYLDNIYTIHAATQAFHDEMTNEIAAKIVTAQNCAGGDGGQCGIPASSEGGKNEVWIAYGETLEQYDRLVKIMESVAALRARLTAVKAMKLLTPALGLETQTPKDSQSKDDKKASEPQAFYQSKEPFGAVGSLRSSETLSFAQISYNKALKELPATSLAESFDPTEKNIRLPIEFDSPALPKTEHPIKTKEKEIETLAELKDIQEIVDKAAEAHNMLHDVRHFREKTEAFHKMEDDYAQKLEKLKASEECALRYMGIYFADPGKAWSGMELGKNLNRHEFRKGISGWAVEAFQTAKSAETNGIGAGDIEDFSFDTGEQDEGADDPDMSKAEAKIKNVKADLSPGKLEETKSESRKSEMISWQTGAEASKLLAENPARWGTPQGKKMIWTDSKRFYQQYLRRKYDNMKAYLKRYTTADVLEVLLSKNNDSEKIKKDLSETAYQKSLLEKEKTAEKTYQEDLEKMKKQMQEYKTEVSARLEKLMKEKEALINQADKEEEGIRQSKKEIADLRAAAEDSSEEISALVNAETVFPVSGQGSKTISEIKNFDEISSLVRQTNKKKLDDKKIKELQKKADSHQKKLEKLNKQIENKEAEIAAQRLLAQEEQQKSGGSLASIIAKSAKTLAESKGDADTFAQKSLSELVNKMPILSEAANLILPSLQGSLDKLNSAVDAIIDAGYQEILNLGDDLYTGAAQAKVVEIHNRMITEIKALKLAVNIAGGLIKIDDILAYTKLLAMDTSPETEGFFVGASPKARDMKAPYPMRNFNLPPVREVFHFDVDDYSAIKPYAENNNGRSITASEFLNFGGDIPEIWKIMLKANAFIESDYYLSEGLSGGCEETAFSRGGIMPCALGETVIDVDLKGNYAKRKDLNAKTLPRCYRMENKNKALRHSFWKSDIVFVSGNELAAPKCSYSELGMLLEADEDNKLKFKKRAYDAYSLLQRPQPDEDKKMSKKDKNALAAAQQAMLDKNQIGDFLRHVESEQTERQNLEEAKDDFESQKTLFKEKMTAFGYTPTDDFDISKQEDYNKVIRLVKEERAKRIKEATEAMEKLEVESNIPAKEKKRVMDKEIALMTKDEEGWLQASAITAESPTLEEDIKKAATDAAVVDKLKNSLKEREKDYTDSNEVFCGNFN